MDALRNILVIVDPTVENAAAVHKAARLATATGAAVELHVCDYTPALDAARYLDQPTLAVAVEPVAARHQLHLDRLAAGLGAAGIAVTTSIAFDNPLHEAILRKVAAARPDLVVKDTHHHGAIRRTLFSHCDWHLIRECPVPLLLARQAPWAPAPRLAAAIDPSHPGDTGARLDHAIIAVAATVGAALGTRPWLVHVFSTLNLISLEPGLATMPLGTDLAAVEVLRTLHQTQLEGLAARHGIPAADTRLIDGIVTYALPDFAAENGLDVLAIGAIARSRLHDRFIGSTADRVLDRLACDLLIVKPPAARAA